MTGQKKGFIYAFCATTLWGFTGVAAKIIFSKSVNPFVLVQVRLSLSFFILFFYLLLFSRNRLKIELKDIPYFAVYGIIGLSGVQFTYLYTMSRLNVGTAVFMQSLSPALIFSYMAITKTEKINGKKLGCLVLSLSGCYFMFFGFSGIKLTIDLIGLISGLLLAVFATFYTIYSKKGIMKYSPWTLLTYGLGFGALFWWFIIPPWSVIRHGYDIASLGYFLYIAVFSTVIPFGCYFTALSYIPPTTASIIDTLEPVVAAVMAFVILGEKMMPGQIVGALLMLSSIVILNIPGKGEDARLYIPKTDEKKG